MKVQPRRPSPVETSPEPELTEPAPTAAPTFGELGLAPDVLAVLEGLGFTQPTPIQVAAIPPLMSGRDVVGRARTGTGKTAAFGLPLLSRVGPRSSGRPRGLVLAPTRELALQVTAALKSFAARPLRIITVYGGAPYGPQLRALRDGVEIVVGTPGRIIDLMDRQSLVLSEIEMLVLDEADEMLKMGFIEDVEKVLSITPESRQVALFSATMPEPIRRVAERWLKDPVQAADAKGSAVAEIEQCYLQVPARNKREALVKVLHGEPRGAAIVFAATKIQCDEIALMLAQHGFQAEALHGDLSQAAREKVVQQLRDKRLDIVVATDIAARGIDIDHLSLIINLDLPKNIEVYTHRIGRTGRAGKKGRAITFVVPRESLGFVQALSRQGVKVVELFLPSERVLVERRRAALVDEVLAWLGPDSGEADASSPRATEPEVARRWVRSLVADGVDLEALAAAALGSLARDRSVSLDPAPDGGVPPWARQPTLTGPPKKAARADAPAAAAAPASPPRRTPRTVEAAPERAEPAERQAPSEAPPETQAPPSDARRPAPAPSQVAEARPAQTPRRTDREPQAPTAPSRGQRSGDGGPGEGWVVVGVGRNDGVRPSDIVGALANELGLPGASIGRIEVRDQSTLVQVVADFAERLGDDSWPLQVRRIDTQVTRQAAPQRARRLSEPTRRDPVQDRSRPPQEGPSHPARKTHKAYPAHTEGPRATARPRAGTAAASKPTHTKSRSVHEGNRAEGGQRPPRRPASR